MPKSNASSIADLLATTPFVFGFHPDDSLVALAFSSDEMICAVRYDLPRGVAMKDLFDAAMQLIEILRGQAPETVSLIAYVDEEERARHALGLFSRRLTAADFRVLHEIRVTDGRYWSYLCSDVECCPPEGRPCPPPHSVKAAEATFDGAVALPSRRHLEVGVAPVTGAEREAMRHAERRAIARLARVSSEAARSPDRHLSLGHLVARSGRKALREAECRYREGGRLNDDEMAWLGVTLASEPVRRYAWSRTGRCGWEVELWSDMLRRVDPANAAPAATLLSYVAWCRGKGALASIAIQRALDADASYPMAGLMNEVLCNAVPPWLLEGWREPTADRQVGILPGGEPPPVDRAEHWRRLLRSSRRRIR